MRVVAEHPLIDRLPPGLARTTRARGRLACVRSVVLAIAVGAMGAWTAAAADPEPSSPPSPPADDPPLILGEEETIRVRPGDDRRGGRRETEDGGDVVRVRPRGRAETYHDHDGTEVVRFGESIEVARDDRVRGAVLVIDGDAYIDGEVEGDVVVLGGHVEVSGYVGGSVVALFGWVELDPEAVVEGDVVALGGRIDENGAEVGGDAVELALFSDVVDLPGTSTLVAAKVLLTLLPYGLFLLLLAVAFSPGTQGMATEALRRPLRALGVGLLAHILVVAVGFVLCVTLVGIPVALLVGAVHWIAIQIGLVVGGIWLGRTMWGGARSRAIVRPALATGLLLLVGLGGGAIALGASVGAVRTLGMVLLLGGSLLELVLVMVGTGALVTTRFGERPAASEDDPDGHLGGLPQAEAAGRVS